MKSKDLDYYFSTLITTNEELNDIVDFEKVFNDIEKNKTNLKELNFLFSNSTDELEQKIELLWKNNKKCFESLPLLVAIKNEEKEYLLNGLNKKYNDFIKDTKSIKEFIFESRLYEILINGRITNLVDYLIGVGVGLDSNARKNRNGKKVEKILYNKLKEIFSEYEFIEIKEQAVLEFKPEKKFDFVITNKKNNKSVLIESSFYNTQGSKIQETARSYLELFNQIKSYSNQYTFIWLADGNGMKSIKKILNNNYGLGYIMNHKIFLDEIKDVVIKQSKEYRGCSINQFSGKNNICFKK